MANLAIKGHATRGKEVINLLEMLGANRLGYKDTFVGFYYYIECGAICSSDEYPPYSTIFTLEQFEEKYPYKIGDKVVFKFIDTYVTDTIKSMEWYANGVVYTLKEYEEELMAEDLQPFKEETTEEEKENFAECIEKTIQECLFGKEGATKEIKIDIPEGYEFFGIDDNNKVVLTKIQPQYPKTYEECCKALMGKTDFQDFELVLTRYTITSSEENSISLCPPHISLINNFYKLLICRDAYWKIAGEQMGLGKPWEPDWTTFEGMPAIFRFRYNIVCDFIKDYHCLLVFPTEEMRDDFYENFKDLIEQCKELL